MTDDPHGWDDATENAIAGALGALAGTTAGGSLAAIVGAAGAAPLVVRALARFLEVAIPRKWSNAGAVLDVAAVTAERSAEQLVDDALADPKRTLLLAAAIDAATRTAMREKLAALGRAVAAGITATDDAEVDLEALVIAALHDIEIPHVEIVRMLGTEDTYGDRDRPHIPHAWSLYEIEKRQPRMGAALEPVLQTLVRHGLLEVHMQHIASAIKNAESMARLSNRRRSRISGLEVTGGREPISTLRFGRSEPMKWKITDFGLHVLSRLQITDPSDLNATQ
jgi:hypothetical protein